MQELGVSRRVSIEPNKAGLLQSSVPAFLHENQVEADPPRAYWPDGGDEDGLSCLHAISPGNLHLRIQSQKRDATTRRNCLLLEVYGLGPCHLASMRTNARSRGERGVLGVSRRLALPGARVLRFSLVRTKIGSPSIYAEEEHQGLSWLFCLCGRFSQDPEVL